MITNLFVSASTVAPRKQPRSVGYVLEAQGKTVSEVSRIDATYNAATLSAILEALRRMRKQSGIRIHSYNRHVLAQIGELEAMQAAGYLNARGEPMANQELWQQLSEELARILPEGQQAETVAGDHEYHAWLISEMKRGTYD